MVRPECNVFMSAHKIIILFRIASTGLHGSMTLVHVAVKTGVAFPQRIIIFIILQGNATWIGYKVINNQTGM